MMKMGREGSATLVKTRVTSKNRGRVREDKTSYKGQAESEGGVAPPTQGTWRSNDYVNAVRLVDMVVIRFYGVSGTGII